MILATTPSAWPAKFGRTASVRKVTAMPRMTRADFLDQCTGLFEEAARNLHRDGAVHGVVMGLNTRGADAGQLIIGDPAALSDEDRRLAEQHGIVTVPGQFRDHAATIGTCSSRAAQSRQCISPKRGW